MAGTATEDIAGGRSVEGQLSAQCCQSVEALGEWRFSEQMENGTPSTSPPYWDTDDSDDDGPKPSELYGKHTWKIEKFSQINKRELRSNAFEVGNYKWYILIYPQGCDVSNHLSLFLCVANHDKLLPGWSHFAQFTIAVVNKDPKKSKYSDTLHRFWKKEHDWGWKKFMELTKISDGFIDADTLIIKAQVQVIREKAHHPFRCLDCQYRRELVRVYLTNVEQICRRFVEDRRCKLGKLLEDTDKWSSFCSFWLGIDQNARRRMSREKMDMILKVIVKQFFIEKEVTSTLVMDSLYSGLKALKGQSTIRKGKGKSLEGQVIPAPVVRVEKDMFVLVDDVLLLLERAAMEPLPPKDEKGPQNRMKDGSTGEDFSKDSIERDERRLTELGRRTVEIFVLAHIFSNKIEAAYQEAIALKRQEELIREETVESEQKAKRGMAEKEKKLKKKQAKQKRNSRKGKDKVRDEKAFLMGMEDRQLEENTARDGKTVIEASQMPQKDKTLEDASDASDSEDRDVNPVNLNTCMPEVYHTREENCSKSNDGIETAQIGVDKRSLTIIDACSTDSAPSLVTNGSRRANSLNNSGKSQISPARGKSLQGKLICREAPGANGRVNSQQFKSILEFSQQVDVSLIDKTTVVSGVKEVVMFSQEPVKQQEQNTVKKDDEVVIQRKPTKKTQVESDRQLKRRAPMASSPPLSPPKSSNMTVQLKSDPKSNTISADITLRNTFSSKSMKQYTENPTVPQAVNSSRANTARPILSKPTEKPSSGRPAPTPTILARPSSAPIVPGVKPESTPPVSMAVQSPTLSRAASPIPDQSTPSPAHSYVPQSYRDAVGGASSSSFSYPPSSLSSSTLNQPTTPPSPSPSASPSLSPSPPPSASPSLSPAFSQQPVLAPGPIFFPQGPERVELASVSSKISLSPSAWDGVVQSGGRNQWTENFHRDANTTRNGTYDCQSPMLSDDLFTVDMYSLPVGSPCSHSEGTHCASDVSVSTSGRQYGRQYAQGGGGMVDEFPHIDIINDLLDDEQGLVNGMIALPNNRFPNHLGDMGTSRLSGDMGPSSLSSCRFERNPGYHDQFQPDRYLPSLHDNHYDALRDLMSHRNNLVPYMNGHIDELLPNQWQVAGPDFSLSSMRSSSGSGGDMYGNPEYLNFGCGLNGYTMFRPSSGH